MDILNGLFDVTDYNSMRRRLAFFTLISSVAAIWVMRMNSPAIDAALGRVDGTMAGFGLGLGGYWFPAVVVAILSYAFQLHNLISHVFRFRYIYDTRFILKPMAIKVGSSEEAIERKYSDREDLMSKVFYKYASSRSPLIDEHLIHRALDSLSWFWVVVEAWFVFTVSGIILCSVGVTLAGFKTIGITTLIGLLLAVLFLYKCIRCTKREIDAILSDPDRFAAVRKVLNALHD